MKKILKNILNNCGVVVIFFLGVKYIVYLSRGSDIVLETIDVGSLCLDIILEENLSGCVGVILRNRKTSTL